MAGIGEAVALGDDRSQVLLERLKPGPGLKPDAVAEHQRGRVEAVLLQIVGERGFDALTIREIARLSGVSSSAFYKLYGSKEECFLRAHEMIVRRVARAIVAAQADQADWRDCLRATFEAFVDELERDPLAARLLLVEAYSAGPVAVDQVRRAERTFETRIADCFGDEPDGIEAQPLIFKGIASGMICLARTRLLDGREDELSELPPILTEWVLSLCSPELAGRSDGVLRLAQIDAAAPGGAITPIELDETEQEPVGDRALILGAVAKLAVSEGYEGLTVPSICLAAGVSRRRFHLQYAGVEDCFAAAAESRLAAAFALAATASMEANSSPEDAVCASMETLCKAIVGDSALLTIGFAKVLDPGIQGLAICRQAIDGLRDLIASSVPPGAPIPDAQLEASAGAMWGLLCHMAVFDRTPGLTAAALCLFALAPLAVPTAALK